MTLTLGFAVLHLLVLGGIKRQSKSVAVDLDGLVETPSFQFYNKFKKYQNLSYFWKPNPRENVLEMVESACENTMQFYINEF